MSQLQNQDTHLAAQKSPSFSPFGNKVWNWWNHSMSRKRNHHADELYTGLDEYSLPRVLILQEISSVSMPSSDFKFFSNKMLASIYNLKCPHNSFSSIFVPEKQSS